MAAPYPKYLVTGKENALYSLYSYLQAYFSNITFTAPYLAPNINPIGYGQTNKFPCLTIEDVGAPSKGSDVIGRYAGNGKAYITEGTIVHLDIEDVNSPEASSPYLTAEAEVRRLRDLTRYALTAPGIVNYDQAGNATALLSGISLVDQFNGNTDTGSKVWMPFNEPGHWNETFIANQENAPDMKKYRITCRIHWIWYQGMEAF